MPGTNCGLEWPCSFPDLARACHGECNADDDLLEGPKAAKKSPRNFALIAKVTFASCWCRKSLMMAT
jgi:hypothetical protein